MKKDKTHAFFLREENQFLAPILEKRIEHTLERIKIDPPPSDPFRPAPNEEEIKSECRNLLSTHLYNEKEREHILHGFDLVIENLPRLNAGERIKQELIEISRQLIEVSEELAELPNLSQAIESPVEILGGKSNNPQSAEIIGGFFQQAHDMQQKIGITPLFVSSISELGSRFFSHHEFEKALSVFQFLSLLAPTYHQIWFSAALCCHRLRRYAEAIANYSIAIITNGWDIQAFINLALCYQAVHDQDNKREILHIAEEMVKKSPFSDKDKQAWNEALALLHKESYGSYR